MRTPHLAQTPRQCLFRRLSSLLGVVLGAILAAPFDGAAADAALFPTGLRPPTPEERQWMDRNMVKAGSVRLNQLGLERVNQARGLSGQAALAVEPVAFGDEILPAGVASAQANSTPTVTGTLPAAADNSTLNCFPPVRNQGSIGSCASFSTTY